MNSTGLGRALAALGPYLDHVVVCGAWAWYLFRRCLGAPAWTPREFTIDLDCIGRERLPMLDRSVSDRFAEEGFVWVPHGYDTPPAARFVWPNQETASIEVEFLVPVRGDGGKRTVELQRGLVAQALRHLQILVDDPLSLMIEPRSPLAEELGFHGTIRVPRVGHFAVQKALIHDHRSRGEQVKDVFSVVDLIDSQNGLSDIMLADVLDAAGVWSRGVDRVSFACSSGG